MQKRTIVITVFHSFVSRNLLYGAALERLLQSGARIVLLVPSLKESHFRELFAARGLQIVGVDVLGLANRPRNLFLQRLSFLLIRSHYLWYKQVERREASGVRGSIKYLFERMFVLLFAHAWARPVFRTIFNQYADLRGMAELSAGLAPDLFVSTDVFNPADYLLLRAARMCGVSTLAMIRSWDNCYSKGLLPALPDRMLTNTHLLKDEASAIHGMPASRIEVIGLPQMDSFFHARAFDRSAFMRKIGAPADAKLIVFAPGGSVLTDIDWQTCQILRDAITRGAIRHKVHILVRNHPHHPADLSRFGADAHFTIERPGQSLGSNTKDTELLPSDQNHLYQTLAAADVVLWVATTLSIDAAALDRPQIMVNFDGFERRSYSHSVRKYHDEDHMRKLVETGGARVARSRQELVDAINEYLNNPGHDRENRRKIVETQIVYTDGESGERFARAVLAALADGNS